MANKNVTRAKSKKDAGLDAVYEGVMNCRPIVPPEEMEALADLVFSKEKVIRAWRCAALIGSKDGAFFRELSTDEDKAQTLAPIVGALKDAATLMRVMAEIMDSASTRIVIAGCNHEKFNDWAKEAA